MTCDRCGTVLTAIDDDNNIFKSIKNHEVDQCMDIMQDSIDLLKEQLETSHLQLQNARNRLNKISSHGVRSKIIAQARMWRSLARLERHRRIKLQYEIMKIYAILDFRVQSGLIVDDQAKFVAEYAASQLQSKVRESSTWP